MMQPRPYTYRRRLYTVTATRQQTFRAQGKELANKAFADLTGAALTRIVANGYCRTAYPDYALCNALNNVANQQAKKASDSLLILGVFALVAAIGTALTSWTQAE